MVRYEFVCDGCGAPGLGEPGDYLYPDPPLGWRWRFGSALEGPHACSPQCWDRVGTAEDGRLIIWLDHDKRCQRVEPQIEQLPPAPPPVHAQKLARVVYFIRAGESGPVKIGCSRNPEARRKQLQSAHAARLVVLAIEPGGEEREQQLHREWAECRLEGEWFAPTHELLAYITSLPVY